MALIKKLKDKQNNTIYPKTSFNAVENSSGKTLDVALTELNNNLVQKFDADRIVVVPIDTTQATVDTPISVDYPSGFNRSNCVCIGLRALANTGVYYGYVNNNAIMITLADSIIAYASGSRFVGVGTRIDAVLMKI